LLIKKILKRFLNDQRGYLLQIVIALILLGSLSFWFWNDMYKTPVETKGSEIKTKIESDSWLSGGEGK